jgi:hypothetical protein
MLALRSVVRPAFQAGIAPRAVFSGLQVPVARQLSTQPSQHEHVTPQTPGKAPSFFKRISVEVTPLIFFVGCVSGARMHLSLQKTA